jgi:hypothetical protein
LSDDKHKDMKWYTTLDRLQSGYFKEVAVDENEVSISREIGEGKTKHYLFVTVSAANIVSKMTTPLRYSGKVMSYRFEIHISTMIISDL